MLIPFPFAFLTGAWGFGLAGAVSGRKDLTTVWRYLVPTGIAAGLAAAVPGLVDYVGTVPPNSSGKARTTKHAVINTAALGLCSLGWMAGRRSGRTVLPLTLHGIGAAAMSFGAWLGGTLAYRNQIGVDHRYANAGKWREQVIRKPDPANLASTGGGLELNQMTLVRASARRVVVARTEAGYAAFSDRCTHRGGPLSDGVVICGRVQCPWHGSQFDVGTGEVKCGPAQENIETYPVADTPAKTARPI